MCSVRQFMTAGSLTFDSITGRWFDAGVSAMFLRETELFAVNRGFDHRMGESQEQL